MDYLILTTYLIAQERLEEAESIFNKINKEEIEQEIQYDYIHIYLMFQKGDEYFPKIKDICDKYMNYPFI